MKNDDIIDNIIYWLNYQKKDSGEYFFCTRDIAEAMNISIGETRKYLDELHLYGVIGRERGLSALWFLY